jgi:cardiolipin synthase A/B
MKPRHLALALVALGCTAHRPPAASISPQDAALGEVQDCAAFEHERLERRLSRRTHSELREGNAAELLVNGVASFERRVASAREADVILVKTFIFSDDVVGRELAALLTERAAAGALVVVQYDFVGSMADTAEIVDAMDRSDEPPIMPLLQPLVDAGGIVIPTNAPGSRARMRRWLKARSHSTEVDEDFRSLARFRFMGGFLHFDHEKYWITGRVDGEGQLVYEAIMGGMNIASEYAWGGTPQVDAASGRGGWRDTDVALRGPVAEDITERFFAVAFMNRPSLELELPLEDLRAPQPAAGGARVRFVWNQPAIGKQRKIERLYRSFIRATPPGSVIRLESAYFTPSWRIRLPLERSLRRGTRLAVVTNSAESTDIGLVAVASQGAYDMLLDVSPTAALYEWQPQPGLVTLHAKVASFGRCGPVIIGSANLDGLSSEHNTESVVLIYDPDLRSQFDAMYEADLEACERVTTEQVDELPWATRIWRRSILRVGWQWLSG